MSKLKEKRKAAGMTVAELADAAEVKLQTLKKYESGIKDINKAAAGTVKRLAKILNCNMEEIIE